MAWLSLLKPLVVLLERIFALVQFWRAAKAGRDEERLRHELAASRKAAAAARARADLRSTLAADPERLHDNDGYRRD